MKCFICDEEAVPLTTVGGRTATLFCSEECALCFALTEGVDYITENYHFCPEKEIWVMTPASDCPYCEENQ